MSDVKTIAEKLKGVVKACGGPKHVAAVTGIPESTLKSWTGGTADPKFSVMAQLAKSLKVSLDEMIGLETHPTVAESWPIEDLCLIPLLDVEAAAGAGVWNDGGDKIGALPFSRRFLRRLGIQPEAAAMIRARGDSMYPTIPDRAVVLVDTGIAVADTEGIYALDVDGQTRIKRVQPGVDGTMTLLSENKEYPPERISGPDLVRVKVRGRVRWTERIL